MGEGLLCSETASEWVDPMSTLITEIIEEAPAPGLSADIKSDMATKAVAAARAVN